MKRMLLIDEAPRDADLVSTAIEDFSHPWELSIAPSVPDALDVLGRVHFDMILIDAAVLDGKIAEGMQLLTEAAPRSPIVVLSESDDLSLELQTIEYGAQGFLVKDEADTDTLGRAIRLAAARKTPSLRPDDGDWSDGVRSPMERRQHEESPPLAYFERNWQNGRGFWSPGFFRLLGIEPLPEPLTHERFMTFVHEEDRERVAAYIASTLETEGNMDMSFRIVRQDGRTIDVHGVAESEYTTDGEPLLTRGVFLNVSGLKRTLGRYRSYVDNAPYGVFIADAEGRYLDVNQAACDTTGFSREELLVRSVGDLIPDDRKEQAAEHFARVLADGRAGGESPFCTKSGERRIWSVEAVRLSERLFMGFTHDVTEQRRSQDALERSENMKNLVLDSTSELFAYHDLDLRILWTNKAAADSVGKTAEELVGKHCYHVWKELDEPCPGCPVVVAKETLQPQESEQRTPDGRSWAVRGYPILDQSGELIALAEIARETTEVTKAHAAVVQSEALFRSIYDHVSVGIARASLDGAIEDANPAFHEMLGYPDGGLTGTHVREITTPRSMKESRTRRAELARGDIDHFRMEGEIVHKDGSIVTGILDANLIRGADGAPIHLLGSVVDISKQKEHEAELRRALEGEKRLAGENSAFFMAAKEVLSLESFEETARNLFDACRSLTGAVSGYVALLSGDETENELLFLEDGGLPCTADPDLPMPIQGLRAECYRLGRTVVENDFTDSDWAGLLPDGHEALGNVLFAPLNVANTTVGVIGLANKPTAFTENDVRVVEVLGDMIAIALDISRTRDSLSTMVKWNRSVLDALPDALFVYDESGKIFDVNSTAERRYGYSREELMALTVRDLSPRHLKGKVPGKIKEIADGKNQFEWIHARKDGGEVPVEIHSRFTTSADSDRFFVASVRDISNRKALEEQLLQAQKMESVGRLAGGVAHDFNNLLTAIQGFSDLIEGSLVANDPIREDLTEIQRAADSAATLTNQLLAFSRKQVIAPRVLDLNRRLSGSERMLRRIIGEDIDLVFRPASGALRVLFDQGQLDQVLVNLAVNSRDAMPDGGRLVIETGSVTCAEEVCGTCSASLTGEFAVLRVRDSGTGIEPTMLKNIFEPFFTTKGEGKGTGLGLSTIHGIVHQNLGHIFVQSELGHGTEFSIYLPISHDETSELAENEVPRSVSGRETILLVEDQSSVRKLAKRALVSRGYSVIEAENGGVAFLKFEKVGPQIDLLLTDVVMPTMGGEELYERLLGINPDLKALFMSGYTEERVIKQRMSGENTDFIQKPFQLLELAGKVRALLDRA